MDNENFIQSSLNQTKEQAEKEKKLKKSQAKAAQKKKQTMSKKTEEKPQEAGRNKNGTFAKNNKISVGNGRPPIFSDPDELAKKIDEYIDNCPDTKTCYTSDGIEYEVKVPTISGMAFYLGFESRQSMYDYKNKDNRFSYIIKRSMFYIENHYEKILQGKAPTGAIFALKNMGWKDKTEVDNNHKVVGRANISFGDTSKKEQ